MRLAGTRSLTVSRAAPAAAVLIVDDDAEMAALFSDTLEQEGFRVTVETRGERAIALAERARFDAFIVDKEMPHISGLDLVSFLRYRFPDTPVIFTTAFGGPLVAQEARRRGASRYLEKPVRLTDFVDTVRSVMTRDEPASAATRLPYPVDGPTAVRRPPDAKMTQPTPPAPSESSPRSLRRLWAIVLAGGQGERLRRLTRYLYGDARPKQYVTLLGSKSLLGQTLDRVALAIPRARTVVVSLRDQAAYLRAEFAGSCSPTLLLQPEDRGTAAGVLFPAHWVQWRDPDATIAVFPSDHFVVEENAFMDHVADAAAFVDRHPRRILLLGAQPTEPDKEYGWIEPGERVSWTASGAVRRVRRLIEKPSTETARVCFFGGSLWNTLVLVAKVSTLVEAGRQFLWSLHDRLVRITPFAETDQESRAIRQAYALAPHANFSSAILENCAPVLGVLKLTGVTWCDWGSPRRVIQSLRHAGITPPWLSPRSVTQGGLGRAVFGEE